MSNKKEAHFGSRFGFIMVAAGAAIGLGNIWRFPYLAYAGGGGIFILIYLIIAFIMGHPMVEMETAIGRYGRGNVAASFGAYKKKYKFIGVIAVICTTLIDVYYIIVGGWVLKYFFDYVVGVNFGSDTSIYFNEHIESNISPIIFAAIMVCITAFILYFGITNLVEKVTKIIMPVLFILLIVCGVWAIFSTDGAIEGLKYYLLPDFSKLNFKVIADAATQVLFSVGIGWGIFVTLGASLSKEHNIKKDSLWVTICDTCIALVAGFVIIPSAFGAGVDVAKGPSLIFVVMTQIFDRLPGGRIIGLFFFLALVFAVLSTLFTIMEIPIKWFEETIKITHKKATVIMSIIILVGGAIVSLGFGALSGVKLPWLDVGGVAMYNMYDWLDTFTAYLLLPAGCLLTCFYVVKAWGFKEYEKELTADGRDGKLGRFRQIASMIIIPILMIIILLNCFGFIK
ncbi:MAG: sodium-dependent transporter [Suipraeoptans sp.]